MYSGTCTSAQSPGNNGVYLFTMQGLNCSSSSTIITVPVVKGREGGMKQLLYNVHRQARTQLFTVV